MKTTYSYLFLIVSIRTEHILGLKELYIANIGANIIDIAHAIFPYSN